MEEDRNLQIPLAVPRIHHFALQQLHFFHKDQADHYDERIEQLDRRIHRCYNLRDRERWIRKRAELVQIKYKNDMKSLALSFDGSCEAFSLKVLSCFSNS